jgi:hypothetical protein
MTPARILLLATCIAAVANAAEMSPCMNDPQAEGMRMRMERMHEQMDRAQVLADPAEQRRLLDLHAKHMREGMRELRRRETGLEPACRMELMHAMMEQVIAHQCVAQEAVASGGTSP